MATKPNSVLFIRGLWIHASSWQSWQELFADQGYATLAPGWPGDGDDVASTRANADALNNVGIDEIVDHYVQLIDGNNFPTKPVAVGHSFGGLIAQRLLAANHVAAAVAIDPAPIKGVKSLPLSQLKATFPVLSNPANRHRTVSLTAKQFRYGFGNAVSEEESDQLHERWAIPGPGRPLFQGATALFARNSPAKVDTHAQRGPLLITAGSVDHTVPLKPTREAFRKYADGPSETDFREFGGRGHSLTLDHGWKDVATVALNWLAAKGF
ncbi:alpha/beta hydrolase [Mycobacterium sp.]|uniref:alpha/beta hydrolase n=1 Tax=Mycobacterium sp. TaxID=1785 RepID=UPI003BB50E5C